MIDKQHPLVGTEVTVMVSISTHRAVVQAVDVAHNWVWVAPPARPSAWAARRPHEVSINGTCLERYIRDDGQEDVRIAS